MLYVFSQFYMSFGRIMNMRYLLRFIPWDKISKNCFLCLLHQVRGYYMDIQENMLSLSFVSLADLSQPIR